MQPAPKVNGALGLSFTESHLPLGLSRRQWIRNHFSKEVTAQIRRTSRNTRQMPWGRKQGSTNRKISWRKSGGERGCSNREVCTAPMEGNTGATLEKKLCSAAFWWANFTTNKTVLLSIRIQLRSFNCFILGSFTQIYLKVNVYPYTLLGIK